MDVTIDAVNESKVNIMELEQEFRMMRQKKEANLLPKTEFRSHLEKVVAHNTDIVLKQRNNRTARRSNHHKTGAQYDGGANVVTRSVERKRARGSRKPIGQRHHGYEEDWSGEMNEVSTETRSQSQDQA